MKTPAEIEKLTQHALTSLDNLQQAEANAYLYSKIQNRMMLSRQNIIARHNRAMFRLSAVLVLFACINLTSIYLFNKWQQHNNNNAKAATGINAVSEEYFPKTGSYNY